MLVSRRIRLVQIMETVHRVGSTVRKAGIVLERPTVLLQAWNCVSNRDQAIESLERAIDQGAVGPRAAVRDVEVIAPGLGFEPRRPIGCNAVAKSTVDTAEFPAAAGLLKKLLVAPNPVDQHTHGSPLNSQSQCDANKPAQISGHSVTNATLFQSTFSSRICGVSSQGTNNVQAEGI